MKMGLKEFLKRKVDEHKKELAMKEAVRLAEKQAYYKAKIVNADKLAKAKVDNEIKTEKHKPVTPKENVSDRISNLTDALIGTPKKKDDKEDFNVLDMKII